MAGRKKEGLDGIKDTFGGKRRDDRQVIGRTSLDPLTIDTKNVLTVMYLLQSPEDIVKLRAISSLELFGRKDPENLKLLCSLGIFEYIFPLLKHSDYIARRFAVKLIGMLSSLEEFREQMLKKENILEVFLTILKKDPDAVIQEYSSLTLAKLSSEYSTASELLKLEDCVPALFQRLISADPDIEKNCLDIMTHLLNTINGIEVFIESPHFEMKALLNLTTSSYPVIQNSAIDVLIQLTSWCRDVRVLIAFRDASGIDLILQILEKEEWADLHARTLYLFMNIADSPELCEYLQHSGCLHKFICLLDSNVGTNLDKILGVLARMSQIKRGREALCSVEIESKLVGFLDAANENIQEQACLGIANLAQNFISLHRIVEAEPVKTLLGLIIDSEKNLDLRNLAAYSLSVLCSTNKIAARAMLESENYTEMYTILANNNSMPAELCQNVIQIFLGISNYPDVRNEIISEPLFSAFLECLPTNKSCISKDPALQVDTLECLSEYLVESEARDLFYQMNGTDVLLKCLRSRFAAVREWAGHLVMIVSQNNDFVKDFIRKDGLEWMVKEKNTMYSMPSWQSAVETIFANYLPAKFAYTGRLDFQDITQEGFYILTNPKMKFIILDYFIEMLISPVAPVYVANFSLPPPASEEAIGSEGNSQRSNEITAVSVQNNTTEPPNLQKFMKGAGRNSVEEYVWQGSLLTYPSVGYEEPTKSKSEVYSGRYTADHFLMEDLENLKKRMKKADLTFEEMDWSYFHPKFICNRAKLIAEFVAEELSGPEPSPSCISQFKAAHINEMKYYLGTNILPLGFLRVGDYLERAMLFKVLADRIGFPCALVRGNYGRAWIEIAVPVINIGDTEEDGQDENTLSSHSLRYSEISSKSVKSLSQFSAYTPCTDSVNAEDGAWYPKLSVSSFKGFPLKFLKPNAIVDLVHEPGRLLKINSYEAENYCGAFLFS